MDQGGRERDGVAGYSVLGPDGGCLHVRSPVSHFVRINAAEMASRVRWSPLDWVSSSFNCWLPSR